MLAFRPMELVAGTGTIPLVCHPFNSPGVGAAIGVWVAVTPGDEPRDAVRLRFSVQGNLRDVRVPESRAPKRAEGLWRHTCFEAFVMADGPGYREFNFSPSRAWSILDFRSYRDGQALPGEVAPTIVVRRTQDRLELDAQLARRLLPPATEWRLGLSAVLEHADGALSYWALRHPAGRPDFHHADAFAMQLALS